MNNGDWAIIVGLWKYMGDLPSLKGPKHDAQAFYEWVISKDGGGVPKDHVFKILSSDRKFKGPFAQPGDALPGPEEVERAFDILDDMALANEDKREGRRVGRRLYLYFAGHGIAPAVDVNRPGESALLMANAAKGRFGRHIAGRTWVDWFYDAGYFEEVILFMDCCRDIAPRTFPRNPHLDRVNRVEDALKTKRFLGFGTKWSWRTRERPLPEFGNKDRGIFTVALLEGLTKGGAKEDGRVTALSLKNYIRDRMPKLLTTEDQPNLKALMPDLEILADDEDFLLCSVPQTAVPKSSVIITVPAGLDGKEFEVVDNTFKRVAVAVAAGGEVRFELPAGYYEVRQVDGAVRGPFEVKGTEETIHVTIP